MSGNAFVPFIKFVTVRWYRVGDYVLDQLLAGSELVLAKYHSLPCPHGDVAVMLHFFHPANIVAAFCTLKSTSDDATRTCYWPVLASLAKRGSTKVATVRTL